MFENLSKLKSTSFLYLEHEIETGCRIGGNAPVKPIYDHPKRASRYFSTLRFGEWAISIFYCLDPYGSVEELDVIDFGNRLLLAGKEIHCVVHNAKDNLELHDVPVDVSSHSLLIENEENDVVVENGNEFVKEGCKLGGTPAHDSHEDIGKVFQNAFSQGYFQIAQFETPELMGIDFVDEFPWDPGMLHCLCRSNSPGPNDFAFVIQLR